MRLRLLFTFLALPWLNPIATGPSAAMVPWLVSFVCVGGALRAVELQDVPRQGLSSALAVFFALNALYLALHAFWTGNSFEVLATMLAWACIIAMVVVGTSLLSNLQDLAWVWLSVALLSVAMALCQYVRVEHWFSPWISHSGDGTAFANLRQRNQFASLCGIGLLALLYLQQTVFCSFAARGDLNKPAISSPTHAATHWQTAWPWLAALVLAIGNGLSSSRTGAVQWLLIAGLVFCWRTSLQVQVRRLGYGALGLYALVVAFMPWFANAVGNASNGLWGRAQGGVADGLGDNSRVWLYSNVLELIAQKPWLGWGWRELAYAHYSTAFTHRFGELLDNAHNLPLHLAVELGVPYALLFCGAVLVWVLRAAPWRETQAPRQLAWGVLMLLAVHSMVEYPLWYGPFLMTLGLCLGLLERPFSTTNRPLAQWNIAQAAIKFAALGLLIFAAYASFDYHRVSQIYLGTESRSAAYRDNALGAAQQSVLYQRQARFAELVLTPLTPSTAPRVLSLAADLVHFSPEPRVIEALIESATLLHFDDVAMFHLARYKEMYPKDYAAWTAFK